jgi:heme-degrading monooxygenase HmoA
MHGLPPGTPEKLEKGRDFFRMVMLPTLEETEGFCSASLFVDPTTMRMVSSVVWDSRASMEASRDSAAKLKEAARTQLGVDILDVAEFDLLIAHLRAPEMV